MSRESGVLRGRRKLLVVIVIVVVVAVVAGVVFISRGTADTAVPDTVSTQALERMDLEQLVTATGTVRGADSRNVTGNSASQISKVEVSVGQTVAKGDTLCVMDTKLLDLNIKSARASLDSAAEQYYEGVAQANRRVADAKEQYDYDNKRLSAEVKKAKKALDKAKAKAKKKSSSVRATVDMPTEMPSEMPTATPTSGGVTSGQGASELASLQAAYDAAVSTKKATLRADKSAIKSAQDALASQKLMDQTSTLQGQLNVYLQQKADATVKSPIDGTVTSVNAKAGEYPGMEAPMFIIEDVAHLKIEASVPEYDASLLDMGLGVHIVSDAIQSAEWDGTIESISPTASDVNGNFTVTIEVTSELGALKSGMSAKLNIVSDSRTNVFAVPYGALGKNANGESVIYVKQDVVGADGSDVNSGSGQSDTNVPANATGADRREVVVITGLETDYYVEISGDELTEGLLVLTDPEGLNTDEVTDPTEQFMN